MTSQNTDLRDESFLALTTFRRSGEGVATPVWAARDPQVDGALVVVTDLHSGKVKRLRNNPTITLQPCDARGNVRGETVTGTAVVLDGTTPADEATRKAAHAALRKKYGWQARALDLASKFRRKQERTYLRMTLDDGPGATA
ncbi:PPOX class F420-dependent oxidoreductase [Paraoerskovia marina]|uniref:PPOX class F420-dependent oxidoreductase n=1 Tax=Paraoerskovia marina TaxID=545619 RepID=UPI0004928943|nr:PPOX class F420-dependent oxidoreductase [Paraoerskovia marina]